MGRGRDFLEDFREDWNREAKWNRNARMRGYTAAIREPPRWPKHFWRALRRAIVRARQNDTMCMNAVMEQP